MNPWWKRPAPDDTDGGKGGRGADRSERRSDSPKKGGQRNAQRSGAEKKQQQEAQDRQSGDDRQGGSRRRRRGGRGGKRSGSQRPSRDARAPEIVLCDGVTLDASLADLDMSAADALRPLLRSLDSWDDAERVVFLSEDADPDLRDELAELFEVVTVPSEEEVLLELAMAAAARATEGDELRFVLIAEQESVSRITDKLRRAKHSVTHYVPGESVPEDDDSDDEDRDRSRERGRRADGGRSRGRGGRGQKDRGDGGRSRRPATRRGGDAEGADEAFEALLEAIGELVEGSNRIVWGTLVRQAVHEGHPDFDERDYGFDSFDSLLEAAAENDLVRLERSPDTGTYFLSAWRPPAS